MHCILLFHFVYFISLSCVQFWTGEKIENMRKRLGCLKYQFSKKNLDSSVIHILHSTYFSKITVVQWGWSFGGYTNELMVILFAFFQDFLVKICRFWSLWQTVTRQQLIRLTLWQPVPRAAAAKHLLCVSPWIWKCFICIAGLPQNPY